MQRGKFLGELVKYCKKDLKMESVTIVSNGSLITEVQVCKLRNFRDRESYDNGFEMTGYVE